MKLTKEEKDELQRKEILKKYIKNDCEICIVCKSDNIILEDWFNEKDILTMKIRCITCESRWNEIHKIIAIENLIK